MGLEHTDLLQEVEVGEWKGLVDASASPTAAGAQPSPPNPGLGPRSSDGLADCSPGQAPAHPQPQVTAPPLDRLAGPRPLTSSYSRRRKSISWVRASALASRSALRR